MLPKPPRQRLRELAARDGVTLETASRVIGRGKGYLARFVREGRPKALEPADADTLAQFFGVRSAELRG